MAQNQNPALAIDVVSDVVCPWCYIGKALLEKAIPLNALERRKRGEPALDIAVRFRPYFLNPWVPREGMSREDYLIKKFGSVERYNSNSSRVIEAAAFAGLTYARDRIKRQPNTLDCHRLIRWAEAINKAADMKQRLMALYLSEGADLSDREVLVKAAADCGLDGERVRAMLASEQDVAEVTYEADSAKEAGIDGVPCFILGGVIAVSGAQAPEYLAQLMDRAVAETASKQVAAE